MDSEGPDESFNILLTDTEYVSSKLPRIFSNEFQISPAGSIC
jgi:hypothetical protein